MVAASYDAAASGVNEGQRAAPEWLAGPSSRSAAAVTRVAMQHCQAEGGLRPQAGGALSFELTARLSEVATLESEGEWLDFLEGRRVEAVLLRSTVLRSNQSDCCLGCP